MSKSVPVCTECGSSDILADAYARFDPDTEKWELNSTYNGNANCRNSNCSTAHGKGDWVMADCEQCGNCGKWWPLDKMMEHVVECAERSK